MTQHFVGPEPPNQVTVSFPSWDLAKSGAKINELP